MFRQVVGSMGAERAFRAFFNEGTALFNDINARLGRIEELEGSLKSFSDRRRSKAIFILRVQPRMHHEKSTGRQFSGEAHQPSKHFPQRWPSFCVGLLWSLMAHAIKVTILSQFLL